MSAGEANDGAIVSHAAPHTRTGGHAPANPRKQLFFDKGQSATTISGFRLRWQLNNALKLLAFCEELFFHQKRQRAYED